MNKPHIFYNTRIKCWVCHSEDGPWDICIGAGESVVEAYGDWLLKLIGNDVSGVINKGAWCDKETYN